MSEEEIQNVLNELNTVRPEVLNTEAKKLFEAIMQIADDRDKYKDLYNKEKEKNIIFKRSTIITDIKRHGIEINMSADRLVNEYLLEKIKNSELEELLENSISKDKINNLLKKYENEHFIAKVDLKSILEDNV